MWKTNSYQSHNLVLLKALIPRSLLSSPKIIIIHERVYFLRWRVKIRRCPQTYMHCHLESSTFYRAFDHKFIKCLLHRRFRKVDLDCFGHVHESLILRLLTYFPNRPARKSLMTNRVPTLPFVRLYSSAQDIILWTRDCHSRSRWAWKE